MRNHVKELRESEGLSQKELGATLRHPVSRQTINSVERGRYTPSLVLAMDLAHHFGTPIEEIFHADEGRPADAKA
jgi:putative transcriptional regulator